ncbi:hypothetical protein B0H15DRAFT_176948 [Mycena belliarum]|uniref:Uncharacterized protein n=1 Tax=Mycena belliarum TaxID=1033014 RepID=A0AAD6TPY5_9AGAR|nr:hypothetical protein B0H15DRAFT_176948 [Mycena belliae]
MLTTPTFFHALSTASALGPFEVGRLMCMMCRCHRQSCIHLHNLKFFIQYSGFPRAARLLTRRAPPCKHCHLRRGGDKPRSPLFSLRFTGSLR